LNRIKSPIAVRAVLLILDLAAMWMFYQVFLCLKPPVFAEVIFPSGLSPFLTQAPISRALTSGEAFPYIYRYLLIQAILSIFAFILLNQLVSLIFSNNERIFYPQSRK
jgi:hypothetical protein